jgi:hypothetical protein
MAVIANAGGLVEPITMQQWADRGRQGSVKLPPGVFGHNTMQKNAFTVHARDALSSSSLLASFLVFSSLKYDLHIWRNRL